MGLLDRLKNQIATKHDETKEPVSVETAQLESDGTMNVPPPVTPKINHRLVRKLALDSYIEKYGERNVRYYYFRLPHKRVGTTCIYQTSKANNVVTAVTILDRATGRVKVSFAFCSDRDQFCKQDGKFYAFSYFDEVDHPYVVDVPFYDDGFVSTMAAYNTIRSHFPTPYKYHRLTPGYIGLVKI